jgi:multidrug efflux pump subunit AcrA (membrane-fusion protein)
MTAELTELVQVAQSDPQIGQVAQLLAQREETLTKELARQELEEAQRTEEARRTAARRDQADGLRQLVEELKADLDSLRTMLDGVAAALGACPSCWGEDPTCRWCRGRGGPGSMPPDPDGFDRLILPAVRVQALLHRRASTQADQHLTQTTTRSVP